MLIILNINKNERIFQNNWKNIIDNNYSVDIGYTKISSINLFYN